MLTKRRLANAEYTRGYGTKLSLLHGRRWAAETHYNDTPRNVCLQLSRADHVLKQCNCHIARSRNYSITIYQCDNAHRPHSLNCVTPDTASVCIKSLAVARVSRPYHLCPKASVQTSGRGKKVISQR